MRFAALAASLVGSAVFAVLTSFSFVFIPLLAFCGLLSATGIWDLVQSKHSVRRNYPILANIRFMLEKIRPEIRQYFLESETDGTPFNRSKRSVAYQRAKGALDKRPFGTQQDIYGNNFEWINHSIVPCPVESRDFRVIVGGVDCRKPYALSLFNISAMSFGALSANAIRALNRGAKLGGFAHDTGEGGISRYHREFGGDLIWEIGSGYFGCRNEDGSFCADRFATHAQERQVKMIEIKLSQGAKPGHGGVLPGHFIAQLRDLSGGKPVGFKLCIGHAWEFMALCKAMLETGIRPDFIVIDGSEGGTGAAPLEFVDHVGTPLREGLVLAHNCLVGAGLRQSIRLGASGRVVTGFDIARLLALGADWCNAARGFMFALGCIQAQACHTDHCPTGVSTQNPWRQWALVVDDKAARVRQFHQSTLAALGELAGAAGLAHPNQLRPLHILKRISPSEVKSFAEVYTFLKHRELLSGAGHPHYAEQWALADAQRFTLLPQVQSAA
jgi:glutamate synthase domain-containing protein 2